MRALWVLGIIALACVSGARVAFAAPAEWQSAPSMADARDLATATALETGEVLVVGGESSGSFLSTAERFDPSTHAWKVAAGLPDGRDQHVAVLLADGRVLLAGGYGDGKYLASATIYDPTTDGWTGAAPRG